MGYLLGLIGYPAKHSKSPWIHEEFMQEHGLQGTYRIFETSPEDLEETLRAMRTLNVDGFNVTVPYKEKILSYLDEVDPSASVIGAVNTVHHVNGKWIGYNTDGKGYVRFLKECYPNLDLRSSRVLLLGAGGAARGIYRALTEESTATVDIANRTPHKGEALLQLCCEGTTSNVRSLEEAETSLADYDVVIQTTSVGMSPHEAEQLLSLEHIRKDAIVSDIVYKPFETQLLKEAKDRGANLLHGHGMLVYQAALAFEKWTQTSVEADRVLTKFEQQLKGDTTC